MEGFIRRDQVCHGSCDVAIVFPMDNKVVVPGGWCIVGGRSDGMIGG